jgi:hypothetical protein
VKQEVTVALVYLAVSLPLMAVVLAALVLGSRSDSITDTVLQAEHESASHDQTGHVGERELPVAS